MNSEDAGGLLVNADGEVVGFCLPYVRAPHCPEFSYSVPVNQANDFFGKLPIPQWSDGPAGTVCNWLGIETQAMNPVIATQFSVPDRHGEVVNFIENNSPAEQAGLRRGDVIISVNNNRIVNSLSLDEIAPQLCQTNDVDLQVLLDGNQKNLTLDWNKPSYLLPGRGSLAEVVLVVLIFTLMYYLVYKNIFDRVILFVLGAVIMAIMGQRLSFYGQDRIAVALLSKVDVLCFIVGMQLVTGVLEDAGRMEYLAKKITLATRGDSWRIMSFFCIVTYAFSLVINNLTTIMLMAPMVLKLSKYIQCDPKPFLTSMIIASNLGGASTMIGDFPNMLIGAETGLSFYKFTLYMLPICLLELFVLLIYLRFAKSYLFKNKGNGKKAVVLLSSKEDAYNDVKQPDTQYPEMDDQDDFADSSEYFQAIKNSLPDAIKNRRTLTKGLIILGAVMVAFVVSDFLHCAPVTIALIGGVAALAFGGCNPISLVRKVSIRDILFFSGLFVLVGAAEASGMLGYISSGITKLSFGNVLFLSLLLMWVGAFATCFLNAGPATALLMPIVFSFKSAAPHNLYWWALSLGVCAGSSGTVTGATAGPVTSTMVDRYVKRERKRSVIFGQDGEADSRLTKLTFKEFAVLGLPIMLIFLIISSVYIAVIYYR